MDVKRPSAGAPARAQAHGLPATSRIRLRRRFGQRFGDRFGPGEPPAGLPGGVRVPLAKHLPGHLHLRVESGDLAGQRRVERPAQRQCCSGQAQRSGWPTLRRREHREALEHAHDAGIAKLVQEDQCLAQGSVGRLQIALERQDAAELRQCEPSHALLADLAPDRQTLLTRHAGGNVVALFLHEHAQV